MVLNRENTMNKILLITLVTSMLTSCGLKNKITSYIDSGGQLGVPKQDVVLEIPTEPIATEMTESNVTTPNLDPIESVKDTPVWFYIVPFVILVGFALLVFRLKKQNMKSL